MIDRIGTIILKATLSKLTLSPALFISLRVNFNNNRKDPLRLLFILCNNRIKIFERKLFNVEGCRM